MKQDRSTLRVVDGSQSRGYTLFAGDTPASTAAQLMHRLICSLNAFSLAKEDQVNENA
jgi:hypothetical protein